MIAIGRDGDDVVIFGSVADGLAQIRCTMTEARAALRQLAAVVEPEAAAPRLVGPRGPTPLPPTPVHPIGSPLVVLTGEDDPVREAMARDAEEIAAQEPVAAAPRRRPTSEADQARREARLARIAGMGGTVDGPVDR